MAFRPHWKKAFSVFAGAVFGVLASAVVLVVLVLNDSGSGHTSAGERFETRLKPHLARGDGVIPLRSLTDFEWNEVCFSWPYGGLEFEGSLGGQVTGSMPWRVNEALWGLVFIDDTETATMVSVERSLLEYTFMPYPDRCLCGEVAFHLSPSDVPFDGSFIPTGEPCKTPHTRRLLQGYLDEIVMHRGFTSGMDTQQIEALQTQLDTEQAKILERMKSIEGPK